MDFEDQINNETDEIGSDELLSDDSLHLPAGANPLVRLHAVRAWLTRRQRETKIEMGEAALEQQDIQAALEQGHLRRRAYQDYAERLQHYQQIFAQAQERLSTYEEAEVLLEETVNHVTIGERLLVEYYLEIESKIQDDVQEQGVLEASQAQQTPRLQALLDVLQRIERVGATYEEE